MKRVIVASDSEIENMTDWMYNTIQWFMQDVRVIKQSDLDELDRRWNDINSWTKRELRGFLKKIEEYCNLTGLSINDASDESEDIDDYVQEVIDIIRGITRRIDPKYLW